MLESAKKLVESCERGMLVPRAMPGVYENMRIGAKEEITKAVNLHVELVAMLETTQWIPAVPPFDPFCPVCRGGSQTGHAPDCRLADLLRRAKSLTGQ